MGRRPQHRPPPRATVAALLALALAISACSGGDGAAPAPSTTTPASASPNPTSSATSTTAPPARPERYEVVTREETYVDTSRPTAPNGDFPGAPERTIRVVFHVPRGDGPFPVVLLSHGWIATPEVYAPVLDELAAHGYLAVAPAYPLSNGQAPGGPIVRDVVNQPADASFVLDEVLAGSADEASWLHGLADHERVAAGGHSLGAMTTLGFFNSCCADDRIDATFPVAGTMARFDGTWFDGIDTPILLVHGDQDELVSYAGSREAFERANPPKHLLTLLGGTHADFALGAGTQQWELTIDVVLAFLDGYLRGNDAALDRLAEAGNVAGVSTLESE